jgi:hypothetical protein
VNKHLRIAYHNIEGLHSYKLQTFLAELEEDMYDLIFLAETFYMNMTDGDNLLAHPLLIAHSTPSMKNDVNGRRNGGIVALGNRTFTQQVRRIDMTQHTLTITTETITATAVYLPPSLKLPTLANILDTIPPSDVVFGDFNVRFPDLYPSLEEDYASRNRRPIVQAWTVMRGVDLEGRRRAGETDVQIVK